MRDLFLYIKRHIKFVILLCLFLLIFLTVFWLYALPLEPILYSAILSFAILLVFALWDFSAFRRKHKMLSDLRKRIVYEAEYLPAPRDAIEDDYTQLLKILHEDKISSVSKIDSERQNMIEYYTVWAHQIKTPIFAMRLTLDENSDAELLSQLFKIEQYVDMALSYLKLNSTTNDFVIKYTDLDTIVRKSVRKFAGEFVKSKISLDFKETGLKVLTDEKWLGFILEQILSNSIKYAPNGHVSIFAEEPKTLVIKDNGIGISPEDLPRIFEYGYTGYNGRMCSKSTGLGLFLCKKIAKKLSADIAVTSQPNAGTTVRIYLDENKINVE